MRIFIAVDLEDTLKDLVYNYVKILKSKYNSFVKYVSRENLHITLKFIGEVDEKDLKVIEESLSKVKEKSFSVRLKNLGFFPNSYNPRVLWIGLEDPLNAFSSLYQKVINTLPEKFKEDDKDFFPHLTIARFKEKVDKNLISFVNSEKDKEFGNFNVKTFQLYESKLKSSGAEYKMLRTFPLIKEVL